MSDCRNQVHIDAPVELVWKMIADVERHPEWWPRVVEVECEQLGEGCNYREVVRTPMGQEELDITIESMRDPEEFEIHCLNTGTFVKFGLTEARGGTFVDARMGMDASGLAYRVFDATAGRIYFRRWLAASLESMREAAEEQARAKSPSTSS